MPVIMALSGWGMKVVLGVDKAACAGEITQQSVLLKNLRMGDMKERNTHRERERETQECNSYKIMDNQPLLKVTKSHYIVTHLGQLPFRLFTQMARTWSPKRIV